HFDIIDEQDAELCELFGQHAAPDCWADRIRQRNLEAEPAPFTEGALDADFAAHQLDQLLCDGETQPGATEPTRDRLLGLAEFSEQTGQHLLRDADAGV